MTFRARGPAQMAAALCVAGLASAMMGCPEQEPPKPPPTERKALVELVDLKGQVTLERDGAESPARRGSLHKGDIVITGAASTALLRFPGGRELEVGEEARFIVGESVGAGALELSRGVIVSRVPAEAKGEAVALSILTPFGISRVANEAEARLAVGQDGVAIEVSTGQITFVGKDGKEEVAQAGDKLEVMLGTIRIERGPADGGTPTIELAAVEVRLTPERGQILVRKAGAKRFERATGPASLDTGAAFQLKKGSRAQLTGPGLSINVAGAGEGVLASAVREGTSERYRLTLPPGLSEISLAAGDRELVLESPEGAVTLRAEEETTLQWTQDRKGARAEVLVGKLALSFKGVERKAAQGEVLKLAKSLEAERKGRPALLLPAGKRVKVFVSNLREVALGWPEAPEDSRVEVARDSSFEDKVLSGRAAGGWVAVDPPSTGALFWRVSGADGKLLHQGRAVVGPEDPSVSSENPVSEVAETGLKATVFYQSGLPSLNLVFQETEGASRYRVRVYKTNDLKKALVDRTVNTRECLIEAGRLSEGSYLWSAAALDATGAEVSGGRMNKLDIVYDNARTSLTILRPKQGERASRTVALKGVAPLGNRLYVNGRQIELDATGRYNTSVPAAETLVFRLLGTEGSESYYLRVLRLR